ncbi:hypothetical protein FIV31_00330 [Coxiella endosymbiont of Ornithodoros amblus]|uniref:hypothetical protein n=1 Tax=Coxiella endosymbiont of Ornithodoros amblus TaxID=1656166 RepID=UPI00244E5462|nr:hypothetical protein [Coxiella endosymbiont of Ornithodoros amblus]MBW5802283.1 hypothetical protein [Coxiella endosymbiont of Ornithodoros amblus]
MEVKAVLSGKNKNLSVYGGKYNPTFSNCQNLINLKQDGKLRNYILYLLEKFPLDKRGNS